MAIVDCQTYVLIQLVYLLPEHIIKISPLALLGRNDKRKFTVFFHYRLQGTILQPQPAPLPYPSGVLTKEDP